jgi:hypothetical protein
MTVKYMMTLKDHDHIYVTMCAIEALLMLKKAQNMCFTIMGASKYVYRKIPPLGGWEISADVI